MYKESFHWTHKMKVFKGNTCQRVLPYFTSNKIGVTNMREIWIALLCVLFLMVIITIPIIHLVREDE